MISITVFQLKHKYYLASGSAPPMKNSGCASAHGDIAEDSSLLGIYIMSVGKQLLTFQSSVLPSCSVSNSSRRVSVALKVKALRPCEIYVTIYQSTRTNVPQRSNSVTRSCNIGSFIRQQIEWECVHELWKVRTCKETDSVYIWRLTSQLSGQTK
jgi:hypothetical protein